MNFLLTIFINFKIISIMNTMTYVVMGICLVAVLVLIFVIKYISLSPPCGANQ